MVVSVSCQESGCRDIYAYLSDFNFMLFIGFYLWISGLFSGCRILSVSVCDYLLELWLINQSIKVLFVA